MTTINRRQAIQTITTAFGSVAFAAMTTKQALAAVQDKNPLASRETHFAARAKHVIMLFMNGAPSHVDTFDYKPELIKNSGKSNRTKLMGPQFKFRQRGKSGLWISDLFPNVGELADDLCLIRSMHGDQPNHPTAERAAHTGTGQFIRPSIGAWSTYGLGTENTDLPGFVALGEGGRGASAINQGSAFLPARYAATTVNTGVGSSGRSKTRGRGEPASKESVPNISNPVLNSRAQRTQLDLLKRLNQEALRQDVYQPQVEGIMQSYELAFRMQTSMPQLMDLSKESEQTKQMYGIGEQTTDAFGTQCLMARRMVEAGVRFIELGKGGWDHHTDIKEKMQSHCQSIDKPIAGLLADLKQRGLLKDTLVIWAGEFGRTPHATGSGRGHNNKGFASWMAGGGVKGGFSYGSTDELGYEAVDDKMHTHDWHATILHLLGLDHERLTYRHAGRDFRLTDVHGKVAKEILA
jgi:hypothetical protein